MKIRREFLIQFLVMILSSTLDYESKFFILEAVAHRLQNDQLMDLVINAIKNLIIDEAKDKK